MRTVLELVQEYTQEKGLSVPTVLFASTDSADKQFVSLLNKIGRDLVRRKTWEVLKRRKTLVALATEDQGLIPTIIDSDCAFIIPGTFYNDTQRVPIYGPLGDTQYQQTKALLPEGPLLQFRIQADHIFITGDIVAGEELSLVYKSKAWLQTTASSAVFVSRIADDVNVPVFDDDLMLLGLDYFYRKAKELPYAAQLADYESKIMNDGSTDNIPPIIKMHSGTQPIVRPGIIVPAGNWNVS